MANQSGRKSSPTVALAVLLVILVLGIVALIRCPAEEIPELIRYLGTWIHVSVTL
jgi:hypothetical protein